MKENNIKILLFSCKEISNWYDKNINDIQSNKFVYDP